MELSRAIALERQQQERRGDAVANARLDGDARPETTDEPVEPQTLLVAVPPGDPARVVPLPRCVSPGRFPEERTSRASVSGSNPGGSERVAIENAT